MGLIQLVAYCKGHIGVSTTVHTEIGEVAGAFNLTLGLGVLSDSLRAGTIHNVATSDGKRLLIKANKCLGGSNPHESEIGAYAPRDTSAWEEAGVATFDKRSARKPCPSLHKWRRDCAPHAGEPNISRKAMWIGIMPVWELSWLILLMGCEISESGSICIMSTKPKNSSKTHSKNLATDLQFDPLIPPVLCEVLDSIREVDEKTARRWWATSDWNIQLEFSDSLEDALVFGEPLGEVLSECHNGRTIAMKNLMRDLILHYWFSASKRESVATIWWFWSNVMMPYRAKHFSEHADYLGRDMLVQILNKEREIWAKVQKDRRWYTTIQSRAASEVGKARRLMREYFCPETQETEQGFLASIAFQIWCLTGGAIATLVALFFVPLMAPFAIAFVIFMSFRIIWQMYHTLRYWTHLLSKLPNAVAYAIAGIVAFGGLIFAWKATRRLPKELAAKKLANEAAYRDGPKAMEGFLRPVGYTFASLGFLLLPYVGWKHSAEISRAGKAIADSVHSLPNLLGELMQMINGFWEGKREAQYFVVDMVECNHSTGTRNFPIIYRGVAPWYTPVPTKTPTGYNILRVERTIDPVQWPKEKVVVDKYLNLDGLVFMSPLAKNVKFYVNWDPTHEEWEFWLNTNKGLLHKPPSYYRIYPYTCEVGEVVRNCRKGDKKEVISDSRPTNNLAAFFAMFTQNRELPIGPAIDERSAQMREAKWQGERDASINQPKPDVPVLNTMLETFSDSSIDTINAEAIREGAKSADLAADLAHATKVLQELNKGKMEVEKPVTDMKELFKQMYVVFMQPWPSRKYAVLVREARDWLTNVHGLDVDTAMSMVYRGFRIKTETPEGVTEAAMFVAMEEVERTQENVGKDKDKVEWDIPKGSPEEQLDFADMMDKANETFAQQIAREQTGSPGSSTPTSPQVPSQDFGNEWNESGNGQGFSLSEKSVAEAKRKAKRRLAMQEEVYKRMSPYVEGSQEVDEANQKMVEHSAALVRRLNEDAQLIQDREEQQYRLDMIYEHETLLYDVNISREIARKDAQERMLQRSVSKTPAQVKDMLDGIPMSMRARRKFAHAYTETQNPVSDNRSQYWATVAEEIAETTVEKPLKNEMAPGSATPFISATAYNRRLKAQRKKRVKAAGTQNQVYKYYPASDMERAMDHQEYHYGTGWTEDPAPVDYYHDDVTRGAVIQREVQDSFLNTGSTGNDHDHEKGDTGPHDTDYMPGCYLPIPGVAGKSSVSASVRELRRLSENYPREKVLQGELMRAEMARIKEWVERAAYLRSQIAPMDWPEFTQQCARGTIHQAPLTNEALFGGDCSARQLGERLREIANNGCVWATKYKLYLFAALFVVLSLILFLTYKAFYRKPKMENESLKLVYGNNDSEYKVPQQANIRYAGVTKRYTQGTPIEKLFPQVNNGAEVEVQFPNSKGRIITHKVIARGVDYVPEKQNVISNEEFEYNKQMEIRRRALIAQRLGKRLKKECVHVSDCPMKLPCKSGTPCHTQCGGAHCTHFVECQPKPLKAEGVFSEITAILQEGVKEGIKNMLPTSMTEEQMEAELEKEGVVIFGDECVHAPNCPRNEGESFLRSCNLDCKGPNCRHFVGCPIHKRLASESAMIVAPPRLSYEVRCDQEGGMVVPLQGGAPIWTEKQLNEAWAPVDIGVRYMWVAAVETPSNPAAVVGSVHFLRGLMICPQHFRYGTDSFGKMLKDMPMLDAGARVYLQAYGVKGASTMVEGLKNPFVMEGVNAKDVMGFPIPTRCKSNARITPFAGGVKPGMRFDHAILFCINPHDMKVSMERVQVIVDAQGMLNYMGHTFPGLCGALVMNQHPTRGWEVLGFHVQGDPDKGGEGPKRCRGVGYTKDVLDWVEECSEEDPVFRRGGSPSDQRSISISRNAAYPSIPQMASWTF